MLKSKVYKWLNSSKRNVQEGIALYNELNLPENIPIFGAENFIFSKLRRAYRTIGTEIPEKTPPKVEIPAQIDKSVEQKPDPKPTEVDKDVNLIAQVREEATIMYKNFMNERALVFRSVERRPIVGENETLHLLQRGKDVHRIMKLHDQMHSKYEDLKFVEQYNRLPAQKKDVILDFIEDVDLQKEISNARKYISKMKLKDEREGLTPIQLDRLLQREQLLQLLIKKYNQIKNEP